MCPLWWLARGECRGFSARLDAAVGVLFKRSGIRSAGKEEGSSMFGYLRRWRDWGVTRLARRAWIRFLEGPSLRDDLSWLPLYSVRRDWPDGRQGFLGVFSSEAEAAASLPVYWRVFSWGPRQGVVRISVGDLELHRKRGMCRSLDCPTPAEQWQTLREGLPSIDSWPHGSLTPLPSRKGA